MTSPFRNLPGGGREFTCTSCGENVIELIPAFDFPVCAICRWFDERPQIPKEVKKRCLGREPDA